MPIDITRIKMDVLFMIALISFMYILFNIMLVYLKIKICTCVNNAYVEEREIVYMKAHKYIHSYIQSLLISIGYTFIYSTNFV